MNRYGVRWYRCLLRLYPEAFRRKFADELEADFEAAASEASASGRWVFVRFWTGVASDLVISSAREWLRTPWVPAVLGAAALSTSLFAYAAYKGRPWLRFPSWTLAGYGAGAIDPQLMLLITAAALIPIVGVILGAIWMRPLLRPRSRGRVRPRA